VPNHRLPLLNQYLNHLAEPKFVPKQLVNIVILIHFGVLCLSHSHNVRGPIKLANVLKSKLGVQLSGKLLPKLVSGQLHRVGQRLDCFVDQELLGMGYILGLLYVLPRHVFLAQVQNPSFVFEFLEADTFFKDLVEV
jgi:hypothetical protein